MCSRIQRDALCELNEECRRQGTMNDQVLVVLDRLAPVAVIVYPMGVVGEGRVAEEEWGGRGVGEGVAGSSGGRGGSGFLYGYKLQFKEARRSAAYS